MRGFSLGIRIWMMSRVYLGAINWIYLPKSAKG